MQAFHFKGGQGAKTGTGGHLPGDKVEGKIAAVRGLAAGHAGHLPRALPGLDDAVDDFREFAADVRERTGGIPIGFKLSAQHIEADLDAALEVGVDYVILDGRGGGTGAAPLLFRDNISVPDHCPPSPARGATSTGKGGDDVTLIATGGLRTPAGLREGAGARAPTASRSRTRRSRRSAASACGPATPTTVRWASRRRSSTCGRGCRST